jgi:DNA mismatch endonuclease, patch repair protein
VSEIEAGVSRRPSPRRKISLGGGVVVPYPVPTSAAATRFGKSNARGDTRPEAQLRSELHRLGLRFRKNRRVEILRGAVRPDVVLVGARVAVFVDGCFWHGCPAHARKPRSNTDYWGPKLESNIERDRRVDRALADDGWRVVRVWEHEAPSEAAARIERVVKGGNG